jgi:membrane-associated phospholipid phosphatase
MFNLMRANNWFLVPYLIFVISGGFILILFQKTEIQWFINQHYIKVADIFFKYFTHVGDGLLYLVAILILLFIRYRYAIAMALGTIFANFLVHLFKQVILPDLDRPLAVMGKMYNLHLVDGVKVHLINSFPSGHSATGFGVFLLFAFIINNKSLKFLLFTLAFLIAYSRVYLTQHFLTDIYFGSLFGVFGTFTAFWWTNQWKNPKLDLSPLNISTTKHHVIKE